MTNLLFFLWMLLFPIVTALEFFIIAHVKKVDNPNNYDKTIKAADLGFNLIIYLTIGYMLLKFQ